MFYRGKVHQKIFEGEINRKPNKCSNKYLAILYLISADKTLWYNSKYAIEKKRINLDEIKLNGISPYGYSLLRVAQDIATASVHLTFSDLADTYLISDVTFELIITALKIAREGYNYIGIDKAFCEV